MRTCPACGCHVLPFESTCPHCNAQLSGGGLGARALRGAGLGVTLALSACISQIEAAYGVAETLCSELGPSAVSVGDNPVALDATGPLPVSVTCGGGGAPSMYAFTAPAQASYEFSVIDADFSPAISLYANSCNGDFDEFSCELEPATISQTLSEGETVHLLIDDQGGAIAGSATLNITQL